MPYSGMWRHVDLVWTDVSEEHIASIFRVEKSASEEPAWTGGCRLQLEEHAASILRGEMSLTLLPWRRNQNFSLKLLQASIRLLVVTCLQNIRSCILEFLVEQQQKNRIIQLLRVGSELSLGWDVVPARYDWLGYWILYFLAPVAKV
jgi:hypothetical protein